MCQFSLKSMIKHKRNVKLLIKHFKRQPHKMVKYIQTIRRLLFDHFVGLALNRLNRLFLVNAFLSNEWILEETVKCEYFPIFTH